MLIFILFISFVSVLGSPINPAISGPSRIVGGTPANLGDFPWQVSLRAKTTAAHLCGGTIINSRWILTAAHCVRDLRESDFQIMTGSVSLSEGGAMYKPDEIFVHPEDTPSKKHNDIALVKTREDIQFNANVNLIPMGDVQDGEDVTLSGWGYTVYPGSTTPDHLMYIHLKTYDHSKCSLSWIWWYTITDEQVCTLTKRGEGACGGDSGGPLVHNGEIVGVVSFGQPCGQGMPDIFTRVSSYLDWINETIANNQD